MSCSGGWTKATQDADADQSLYLNLWATVYRRNKHWQLNANNNCRHTRRYTYVRNSNLLFVALRPGNVGSFKCHGCWETTGTHQLKFNSMSFIPLSRSQARFHVVPPDSPVFPQRRKFSDFVCSSVPIQSVHEAGSWQSSPLMSMPDLGHVILFQ